MKQIKKAMEEKSFFKKIFIKFCRKVGYEIIDQNNLFIPTLNKNAEENLSVAGKSSISLPLGKVNIKRQIDDLTIIIRSYTSTEVNKSRIMLDQNKKRIFDVPKIEYTLRTINSVIHSCHEALKEFKIDKKKSYFIGDTDSDRKAAKKFKIKYFNVDNNTDLYSLLKTKINYTI